jgi:hypothetical protein
MDAYIRKEEENMTHKISILGFAGSLRKGSYNKSLLRVALRSEEHTSELQSLS